MTFCFRLATIAGYSLSCFGAGSSTTARDEGECFERSKSAPLYPGLDATEPTPGLPKKTERTTSLDDLHSYERTEP